MAHLAAAHFKGALLKKAHLENAHLRSGRFKKAILEKAHLEKAILPGATFEQAHLERAHLEGAHLQGGHLEGAHLQGGHLERANLEGAHLERAHLERANLEEADLTEAHLKEADFTKAKLRKVDFTDTTGWPDVTLRDANLEGATGLLGSEFAGADLTGATLPAKIEEFKALDHVAEISARTRNVFVGIVVACVYSWLTIATTTDVALMTNTASTPLPVI